MQTGTRPHSEQNMPVAISDIPQTVQRQREYFQAGKTRDLNFRIDQLKKLKSIILANEEQIYEALKQDLGRPKFEAYMTDFVVVLQSVNEAIKKLKKWARPKKVPSPKVLWPAKSEIHYEPFGVALIISPWNYPFQLLMDPLVGAIAAGNCAILKPSELAQNTQKLICKLINENFDSNYIYSVGGGIPESQELLKHKFDYIFFTGGTAVGKIIYKAAAEHLTPVTLELGGKSPCIVGPDADLKVSARRIMGGKFFNAGQTCVAPDYLYVHESIKNDFIAECKNELKEFYGDDPAKSESFGRVINEKHFKRLTQLINKEKVVVGGEWNEKDKYIAPTLLDGVSWDEPIMQEEIFGPILPVFTYKDLNSVIEKLKSQAKPLALYLYSNNESDQEKVIENLSFGGATINDCLSHVLNSNLPFGGVGDSGIGAYHGKLSFETFSHKKPVLKRSFKFDLKARYAPYSEKNFKLLKKVQRFL